MIDLYRKVWRELHLESERERVRKARRQLYARRREQGLALRGTTPIYKPRAAGVVCDV